MTRNNQPPGWPKQPAITLIGAMTQQRIAAIDNQIRSYQNAIDTLNAERAALIQQRTDSELNQLRGKLPRRD